MTVKPLKPFIPGPRCKQMAAQAIEHYRKGRQKEYEEIRNELIVNWTPLLKNLANKMVQAYPGHDERDLVSEAVVKCLANFHYYKPELGLAPTTYLITVAWRAMVGFSKQTDRVITFPPTLNEKCQMQADKVMVVRSLHQRESRTSGDKNTPDVVEDHREPSASDKLLAKEEQEELAAAVAALREQNPLICSYVEGVLQGKTLTQIARKKREIRQTADVRFRSGLRMLRKMMRKKFQESLRGVA